MSAIEIGASMDEQLAEETQINEHSSSNNIDGLKKIIYKYQNRIRQQQKANSQHKKNNEQLKAELKQLNQTLNSLINKVAVKTKNDKESPIKEEIAKRQLQNEMRKSYALRKEVEGLKVRLKVYESQKVGDLYNEIREKDRIIDSLMQNIKLHEQIEKKEMTMDIYKKEEEAQKKINTLTEEIGHLKKKAQEQRKQHDVQERSMLIQSRKMKELQTKQSLPKLAQSHGPKETYELLFKQNKTLKEQLAILEKDKRIHEKLHQGEVDSLKNKIKKLQKNNIEVKEELPKKDKEINSLWLRIKLLEKNGNGTDRESQEETTGQTWIPLQFLDCRRQLKVASNLRPFAKRFDDLQKLPSNQEFRISGLSIRYFEQHIVELRTTYEIKGENRHQKTHESITSFSITNYYQSTKEVSLQLGDFEYITQWEVFLGKGIEFMKIRTSKEQTLEAGNERNSLKCKRLPFDIKSSEKPIACFGILDTRNFGDRQREVLIGLGLILKKKNVFGGRVNSVSKLEKPASLSVLSKYNDKNPS